MPQRYGAACNTLGSGHLMDHIYDRLHLTRKGTPFIKMEFVEGNSLAKWLRDHPEHVMPWRSVVQIVHQLAGALQYAHQVVGIVHRDLKPANLLLGDGGVIKLSDFGIAQLIRSNRKHSSDTGLVGTISYASPQQIAGADPDPADDIYALGATIYELLTGTPPFQGETPEELIQKIKGCGSVDDLLTLYNKYPVYQETHLGLFTTRRKELLQPVEVNPILNNLKPSANGTHTNIA